MAGRKSGEKMIERDGMQRSRRAEVEPKWVISYPEKSQGGRCGNVNGEYINVNFGLES